MSEPTPVPVQKLGQGCAIESLHGVLRVKEMGAPLIVFAIVQLSPEEQDAHLGKETAEAMRRMPPFPGDEGKPAPVTFELISYVNCKLLWNRLRERGGQILVDEVRGAIGLDPEAEMRAKAIKQAEEDAKRPPSTHSWQINPKEQNSQVCRACGAHEDGKPCRPFIPGDLEAMCAHDAYRNEACEECGRDAEPSQTTTEETP